MVARDRAGGHWGKPIWLPPSQKGLAEEGGGGGGHLDNFPAIGILENATLDRL